MSKPAIGVVVGLLLGLLDGASAWFSPEARPMILVIVIGSTIKGLITGLLAGLIALRSRSVLIGVSSGLFIGFVLSAMAAIGQADHYWEIVLPGTLVGAIVGFVTQLYPPDPKRAGILGLLFIAAVGMAAVDAHTMTTSQPAGDVLQDLAPFVGSWKGTSEGQPGSATVERTYERTLGNRFIRVRNRSVYPPQAKNPKGETHEDEGFFSFDRGRKLVVFRQFHVEGFVNQYIQQSSTGNSLVFVTESIENISQGWRARETYTFSGADELEEVFELAAPGKPFDLYSRTRLQRVSR
jgi:hypothetical protein